MIETITLGSVAVLIFLAVFLLESSKKKRQQELLNQRLNDEERKELSADFKIFAKLPIEIRDRLEGQIHLFIDSKSFEPCGGIEEVTLHMQRVIAAQACLLVVNRSLSAYKSLRNILIYPNAFGDDSGTVRLGESWNSGTVILSWESVLSGGRNTKDGHDVSIHEFTHQLDQANDAGVGLPYLESTDAYREWSNVFSTAFEKFCNKLNKSQKTVIDSYGGTNPAEFFAVVTETFIEKPKQLKARYPELYDLLKKYYGLDPIEWN